MSGPLLCCNDTQCRPRFGDIWRCQRHVGDTSATYRAKQIRLRKHNIHVAERAFVEGASTPSECLETTRSVRFAIQIMLTKQMKKD